MVKPKEGPKPTRIWSGAIRPQENSKKRKNQKKIRKVGNSGSYSYWLNQFQLYKTFSL